MKIYGNLTWENEYADSYIYKLEPSEYLWNRIKFLSTKVKELGVFEITEFEHSLEVYEVKSFLEDLGDAEKFFEDKPVGERVGTSILHVSDGGFRYTGSLKHGSSTYSTGWIYFDDVQKHNYVIFTQ